MGDHLKANMMYYHIYLYHGSEYNYYCVITQTLQNGQTLGQFFELLYVVSSWLMKSMAGSAVAMSGASHEKKVIVFLKT